MALVKGQEKGVAAYFERYYTPLVYYATGLLHDEETAREIAAEAFVKLWGKRESLQSPQQVKPLLYKMVHDGAVDALRLRQRKTHQLRELLQHLETSEGPALNQLIETETYHRLYQLLEGLPPRSRQIFRMFYFQKKAIKQIAQELNVSVNTVKTQKLRALQSLKTQQGVLWSVVLFPLFFI